MDACLGVEREVDKVLVKLKEIDNTTLHALNEAIKDIEALKQGIETECPSDQPGLARSQQLNHYIQKVQAAVGNLSAVHKDLHGSVSKVGKAVDRSFVSDFGSVLTESIFDCADNMTQINHVICEHFLRKGMLDIANNLTQDAGLSLDAAQQEPFLELYHILEALKERNLQPALEWTQVNREALQKQGSSLEFRLHRLHFIELVKEGGERQFDALRYAKNFAPFAATHAKELQVLMGTLLYMKQGLRQSPYVHLLDSINWVEICDVFTRDACALRGLSVESPLSVVIQAGCTALPPLLNIKQVMLQRQCPGVWSAKDELPVEIDLGQACRFHSVFACPILRQQSTAINPPVRLVCGHVISRDALTKLVNGNKVKCPYCPVEQTFNDARQIFF